MLGCRVSMLTGFGMVGWGRLQRSMVTTVSARSWASLRWTPLHPWQDSGVGARVCAQRRAVGAPLWLILQGFRMRAPEG